MSQANDGRLKQRIGGAASLLGGLLAAWGALQLPLGNARVIGAGVVPLALSLVLTGLGAWLFLRPSVDEASDDEPEAGGGVGGVLTVALVVALVGLYALVLTSIGFPLATMALMYALYAIGEGRTLSLHALGWAMLTAGCAYLLFVTALGVRMPEGTLWGF